MLFHVIVVRPSTTRPLEDMALFHQSDFRWSIAEEGGAGRGEDTL